MNEKNIFTGNAKVYDLAENMRAAVFQSRQDIFLFLIEEWLQQEVLIKILVENNLVSILYDTNMKNQDVLKEIFLEDVSISDQEADYLIAVLANTIPAALSTWYLHGKIESPKEIYDAVAGSIAIISKQLAGKKETYKE